LVSLSPRKAEKNLAQEESGSQEIFLKKKEKLSIREETEGKAGWTLA